MGSAVKGCFTQSVTAGFFALRVGFFLMVTGHSLINCTVDKSGSTFFHRGCMVLDNRSAFRYELSLLRICYYIWHWLLYEPALISFQSFSLHSFYLSHNLPIRAQFSKHSITQKWTSDHVFLKWTCDYTNFD